MSKPISYAGMMLEVELGKQGVKLKGAVIDEIARKVVVEFIDDCKSEGIIDTLEHAALKLATESKKENANG